MNVAKFVKANIEGVDLEQAKKLAEMYPERLTLFVEEENDKPEFLLETSLNEIEYGDQKKSVEFNPKFVVCPDTKRLARIDLDYLDKNLGNDNNLSDLISRVELFHHLFNHPVGTKLRSLSYEERLKRYRFIKEELEEFLESEEVDGQFDALLDMVYFIFGTFVIGGYPGNLVEQGFLEVQASNLTKLGEDGKPIYREDGKILKGANYQPPKLKSIIERFLEKESKHGRANY